MELILARHGNTFNPDDAVVWVGSQNDLPLVESGYTQAKKLGDYFFTEKITPTAVYTGPLQRMTSYADCILKQLNLRLNPVIDLRLNEIDYGQWSGLTSKQVCEKFGTDQFENWEQHSQWPTKGAWGESEQSLIKRIRLFIDELVINHKADEKILIVASNGCLRYFLDLVPGALQKHIQNKTVKIATGNLCKLSYHNNVWQMVEWNKSPAVSE